VAIVAVIDDYIWRCVIITGSTQATHVDARLKGNIARFINHSCEPNLYPQVLRIGQTAPHLCLFALRDIEEGG